MYQNKYIKYKTKYVELLKIVGGTLSQEEIQNEIALLKSNKDKSIESLSEELRDNEEVVIAAVTKNSTELQYASPRLKDDQKFILQIIILKNGKPGSIILEHVSPNLKKNFNVVLAAVYASGYELEFAHEFLKENSTVVRTAINNTASSLRFASEEMKSDIQVVAYAVSRDGTVLRFAGETIKEDKTVV